jgi:hypothetical protein
VLRVLSNRGAEYCGGVDHHDYMLYLAINDLDHTNTHQLALAVSSKGDLMSLNERVPKIFYLTLG